MKPWISVSGAVLAAIFLLPEASAQTLRAISMVDVSNSEYNGETHALALEWDDMQSEDPLVPATAGVDAPGFDFTGMDSNGNTRTMTYSGTSISKAEFRWGATPALRVFVDGRLANSFYNADNPPYFDATVDPSVVDPEGVPDILETYGNASFTEILQWGGTATNYLAYYRFHIHGYIAPGSKGRAMLLVETTTGFDYWFLPTNFQGNYAAFWTTRGFPAGLGFPQPIKVTLITAFEARTQETSEGDTVEGTYNFGSTITLDEILVADEDGNPVEDWTVEAASGSVYAIGAPGPVFEDGFEIQDAPIRPASGGIASGQCRQIVQSFVTTHASRPIAHLPALVCAPEGR